LEPVTHFLTGACMSRSGLNRKSALATLTMVLAAEAADLDVLWAFKGPIAALQHHRGITHTFLGAPFAAAATVGSRESYGRSCRCAGTISTGWR
jgi:inner membrane protein